MQSENITRINIDLIEPNDLQPRKKFDDNSIKELALSIKEYGILNPILVRKKNNLYQIIAGERRFRAAKLLGLTEIPVIIRDDITDEKITEVALIENLQRENITAIEEAKSYQEILAKNSITEEKLSEMIGKSQSFISNKLRLLNLPDTIQDALINKKISERHARSLLKVKDIDKQNELLQRIINEKLTVKELDNIINEKKITEEEIHNAISDIMKSLDINEEKEEKESDNMNNGSFFPNYNYGQEPNNNNMSLNAMNMQSMNFNTTPAANSVEQPVVSPNPVQQMVGDPNQGVAPIFPSNNGELTQQPVQTPSTENSVLPAATQEETPMFPTTEQPTPKEEESFVVQPTPNNDLNNFNLGASPLDANPITPNMTPIVDIPLFNQQTSEVQPTPAFDNISPNPGVTPVTDIFSQPQVDTPLFNPSANLPAEDIIMPTKTEVETNNEVPVNVTPPAAPDKLSQVQEFLNNNGVNYKLYSNDTGNCIIIEL